MSTIKEDASRPPPLPSRKAPFSGQGERGKAARGRFRGAWAEDRFGRRSRKKQHPLQQSFVPPQSSVPQHITIRLDSEMDPVVVSVSESQNSEDYLLPGSPFYTKRDNSRPRVHFPGRNRHSNRTETPPEPSKDSHLSDSTPTVADEEQKGHTATLKTSQEPPSAVGRKDCEDNGTKPSVVNGVISSEEEVVNGPTESATRKESSPSEATAVQGFSSDAVITTVPPEQPVVYQPYSGTPQYQHATNFSSYANSPEDGYPITPMSVTPSIECWQPPFGTLQPAAHNDVKDNNFIQGKSSPMLEHYPQQPYYPPYYEPYVYPDATFYEYSNASPPFPYPSFSYPAQHAPQGTPEGQPPLQFPMQYTYNPYDSVSQAHPTPYFVPVSFYPVPMQVSPGYPPFQQATAFPSPPLSATSPPAEPFSKPQ